MAFIDNLDITAERDSFKKFLTETTWTASVSISKGYVSSTPTVSLYATDPATSEKELLFSFTHTHWLPQPVGHLLIDGEWSITDVDLSGPLVEAACRLNAVRSVAATAFQNTSSSAADSQLLAEKQQLEAACSSLKQQLAKCEQTNSELLEAVTSLQKLNTDLAGRIAQLTAQGVSSSAPEKKKNPFDKPRPPPRQPVSSPSDGNINIFKQWASDPPAG
uniref:Uncharacterized protein n=1 Tax=Rehmannia torradovirus TaxID=3078460 RepID=A0AA96KS55_9SECO|nr:hypothetical protein [Rehmannia torradovirus]